MFGFGQVIAHCGAMAKGSSKMPFAIRNMNKKKTLRSYRDKQKDWVMKGLKYLGAPAASCQQTVKALFFVFSKLQPSPNSQTPFSLLAIALKKHTNKKPSFKVLGILVSMIFACPGLDFSPVEHLETFAGCAAVTKAEAEAMFLERLLQTKQKKWSNSCSKVPKSSNRKKKLLYILYS